VVTIVSTRSRIFTEEWLAAGRQRRPAAHALLDRHFVVPGTKTVNAERASG
jgi:hypothetical protein